MKTLALTAPTSMVGSMVYNILKDSYNLILIFDYSENSEALEQSYGKAPKHKKIRVDWMEHYNDYSDGFPTENLGPNTKKLFGEISDIDGFINCASVIKPYIAKDPLRAFFINAVLPHVLSRQYKDKLIHLSTDCVFDGLTGAPYTEDAQPNPTDSYGLTRSLGEPVENSLVLRTSTIGPEIGSCDSLIGWVKKQDNKEIKGFNRHLWNGLTTKQFAKIIHELISHGKEYPRKGLYHIFGSDVSKFEMLKAIANKYNIKVSIKQDSDSVIDRRLRTIKPLNEKLQIPSFEEMLSEL
jgi:dTDP-4-dehydrorhamnose reductase